MSDPTKTAFDEYVNARIQEANANLERFGPNEEVAKLWDQLGHAIDAAVMARVEHRACSKSQASISDAELFGASKTWRDAEALVDSKIEEYIERAADLVEKGQK